MAMLAAPKALLILFPRRPLLSSAHSSLVAPAECQAPLRLSPILWPLFPSASLALSSCALPPPPRSSVPRCPLSSPGPAPQLPLAFPRIPRTSVSVRTTSTSTNAPPPAPAPEKPILKPHRYGLSATTAYLSPGALDPAAGLGARAADTSTRDGGRRTRVLYNARHDEGGREMMVEITTRAGERLAAIMRQAKNPRLALRVRVEAGGCHGFQYMMSLEELPDSLAASTSAKTGSPQLSPLPDAPSTTCSSSSSSSTSRSSSTSITSNFSPESDTVFVYDAAPPRPDSGGGSSTSSNYSYSAAKVVIDAPSLDLLNGSKVDFTVQLIGAQFTIIDNPLAVSKCGCGTSFDIKS